MSAIELETSISPPGSDISYQSANNSAAKVPIFIALGSNLSDPLAQLKRAIATLEQSAELKVVKKSRFYQTAPVGFCEQPDFINAVIQAETELPPLALLDFLLALEQQHGRKRRQRWGPRELDLDLLCYGTLSMKTERLILPHPEIAKRAFVLYPWADIAPDWELPHGKRVDVMKARVSVVREPLIICPK